MLKRVQHDGVVLLQSMQSALCNPVRRPDLQFVSAESIKKKKQEGVVGENTNNGEM